MSDLIQDMHDAADNAYSEDEFNLFNEAADEIARLTAALAAAEGRIQVLEAGLTDALDTLKRVWKGGAYARQDGVLDAVTAADRALAQPARTTDGDEA